MFVLDLTAILGGCAGAAIALAIMTPINRWCDRHLFPKAK